MATINDRDTFTTYFIIYLYIYTYMYILIYIKISVPMFSTKTLVTELRETFDVGTQRIVTVNT